MRRPQAEATGGTHCSLEEVGCVMCLLYCIGNEYCRVCVGVEGHYGCPCPEPPLHENQHRSGRCSNTEGRHAAQQVKYEGLNLCEGKPQSPVAKRK